MNRLEHVRQTLPINLEAHREWDGEFVLLDYNSNDGLRDWVRQELEWALSSGLLAYFRTEEPQSFHMAHAKNVAHRLATGFILCNLDADNFTSAEFTEYLTSLFASSADIITRGFGEIGFFGRVALAKDHFERLGGYDEEFYGWGYDDEDLTERGKAMGLTIHELPARFEQVLVHPRSQGWEGTRERNACLSRDNIAAHRLKANEGRAWGFARVQSFNGHGWRETSGAACI